MPIMEQLLVATRRKLLAYPEFAALIGTDVGRDPIGGAYRDGWVFKASDDDYRPDRDPRNTSLSTVTYGWRNSWTTPNNHNTLRFVHLDFHILADQTRPREDNALVARKDAEYRCDRVASAIISCFDDVANRDHHWPNDMYVISSVLWSDVKIVNVPDADGLVSGDLSFALEV